MKILRKGGTLYLVYFPCRYLVSYQLLYILSLIFESYQFIESKMGIYHRSYYRFVNYKGINSHVSKLFKIQQEYYNLDPTLGEKSLNDDTLESNLIFDFDIEIKEDFKESIDIINQSKINNLKKFIEKCNYIKILIENKPHHIQKILDDNINEGLKFANQYKLNINSYYKNHYNKFSIIQYKKKIFPRIHHVDFSKLQLNYEGTYSISYPHEANKISQLIKHKDSSIRTIADMTANIGGNSISFCQYFDFVYSVEIDNSTVKILKNNLETYGFSNFKVINSSCLDFNKSVDYYFYDPPWTGIFYKMNIIMDLYLDNQNIVDILHPNFCLKAPLNYNIARLLKRFPNIEIHNLGNFIIILNKYYQSGRKKSLKKKSLKKFKKK